MPVAEMDIQITAIGIAFAATTTGPNQKCYSLCLKLATNGTCKSK